MYTFGVFLFVVWNTALMFLSGYLYFINKQTVFFNQQLFTSLIFLNLAVGLASVLFWLLTLFKRVVKILNKKTAITIGLIIIGATIVIFPFYLKRNRQKTSLTMKVNNASNEVMNFYTSLFFEVFGYPADERMTTEDELFNQINSYRNGRELSSLDQSPDICQLAQEKLSQLLSVSYTTNLLSVKQYPYEKMNLKEVAEILLTVNKPYLAKNMVELRLTRPFTQTKNVLNDPSWQYGCVKISSYNIALFLGK